MENDPRSWLQKEGYAPPEKPVPPAPVLAVSNEPGEDYEAFTLPKGARPARRMWIHRRNGERHMLEAYPLRVKMPSDDMMMIHCPTDIITLRGRGLGKLAELLGEMKVSVICEFNPAKHREPESDAPRVDVIDLVEMRELP